MKDLIKQHWKKEYLFLIAAVICLLAFYYRNELNAEKATEYLPLFGGLAFGLNTLVQIAQ